MYNVFCLYIKPTGYSSLVNLSNRSLKLCSILLPIVNSYVLDFIIIDIIAFNLPIPIDALDNSSLAFLNMKKIHEEPDVKYVNKAKRELEVVHDELESSWGMLYGEHTSLLSLEKPIHDFIDVFGKKFIQAFSDVYADDIKIDKSLFNIRITTFVH